MFEIYASTRVLAYYTLPSPQERQEPNKNEITTKHTLQHFETKPSYKKKVCKCAVQFSKIRRIKQRNPHRESPQVGPLVCRANALANCRTLPRLRFALVFFYFLISFGTGSLFCSDVTFALGIFLGFYGRLGHGLCLDIGILINPCHDKGSHFLNHVPRSLPACFTALFLGPFTCPRPPRVG